MVVIAIFQCLPYATVFVRCFFSSSSLNLTMSLWERFPCFTNEEMVVQGGYATLHSKTLLASNQTWIWTNVFFLWRALHGFWDLWVRSYFGVTRNGMERSYSWPWSLRFLWLFRLCSWNMFLQIRKQQRGRLLKILKKAIPCTLRNILGPAVFPPSPLLPSGAWALYTPLSLHFAASFRYVAYSQASPTEAPCIYLLMPTGSNIFLHASKKNWNLLGLSPFPSTLILFIFKFLTLIEPPWRFSYNPLVLSNLVLLFTTQITLATCALHICMNVSLLTQ